MARVDTANRVTQTGRAALGAVSTYDYMLQETGDKILQETGDGVLLESSITGGVVRTNAGNRVSS